MIRQLLHLAASGLLVNGVVAESQCKTTPQDSTWPSDTDWAALNQTIDGVLLRTAPVASSCYPGNPFNSPYSCDAVSGNWTSGIFHASLPESIDYPLFSNNSCLPPGASGYDESLGCKLGGLPEYIVNATTEQHVATAMSWAAKRNIRIAIKGTGHDMNGRSSGAYSLSIWTRNFNNIKHHDVWQLPNGEEVEHAFEFGSGNGWGDVLTAALKVGRVVPTGQDPSVGPGGWTQGGGHGPLSSTYGLGAHHVLQATIITTTGQTLIANDANNTDIFWALRGGGGGQYGLVTSYIIRTHPAPKVTMGTLQLVPTSNSSANASWTAAALLAASYPDLMDSGLAGAATLATGATATKFNPSIKSAIAGVAATQVFWGFNISSADLTALVSPVVARIRAAAPNTTLDVVWSPSEPQAYKDFFSSISGSNAAGSGAIMSSRLLGRKHLSDIPVPKLAENLRAALATQAGDGGYVTIGLQGGPGMANMPAERWGSVNPIWRDAYIHFITTGASADVEKAGSPKKALEQGAEWTEVHMEGLWREWAPDTGAYMNEANPYNSMWKEDFYGEPYDKLVEVKAKYDPTESLYVLNGVGSDKWSYDLDSGKLCRVA